MLGNNSGMFDNLNNQIVQIEDWAAQQAGFAPPSQGAGGFSRAGDNNVIFLAALVIALILFV